MLKDTLSLFTDHSLFDACSALLEALHIRFDRQTEEPITVSDFFPDTMPQYLREALSHVAHTYFIGVVNDLSLKGKAEERSLTEQQKDAEQQKERYSGMFLFAVDVNGGERLKRTEINALTRAFNRISVANPVTLFIREGDRLSVASCERSDYQQQWRQGEKMGRVSVLSRIHCDNPHRGHLDILQELDATKLRTFDKLYAQWLKVFNTQVLTEKFYQDLFHWYQWATSAEGGVTFDKNPKLPEDQRESIETKIIRLITRMLFVWFIKQKGLVPDSIFDEDYLKKILIDFDPQSSQQGNYYWAILQNLFFGTLNRPITEDGEPRGFTNVKGQDVKTLYRYKECFAIPEEEVTRLFAHVPYLNCGLFECQDKGKMLDGKEQHYYNDGFTRNSTKDKDGHYAHRAFIPNNLFFDPERGLLSIFNRYVFTIEENTPQDVQVALDPELLGKVFENLLGDFNPETHKTARKESGSFYTPREIVQYMVNESLVEHLKQTVSPDLEPQFRRLLGYNAADVDFTTEQRQAIMQSLITCKVLDPACGSGAFPMGMLQQMVHILQQVDPDNKGWRDVVTNLAVEDTRRAFNITDEEERKKKLQEIEQTFNNSVRWPDYTRKLYLIESCIYGVDIQPIAMLITRLRFFITLVCEQKDIDWNDADHNYGIQTLPNLESKFVAANSLINADIHQYNDDWTTNPELTLLKKELMDIRRKHFYTRKRGEKKKLLAADEEKCRQIHQLITRLVGEPNKELIAEREARIADYRKELDKYQAEDWAEKVVQTELFGEAKRTKYDRNKVRRTQIKNAISACENEIQRELNKTTPKGFEKAVLEVTDWKPYDQASVSPFLDVEWMFGITDGFDIVIGNPPYIQLQNEHGKLGKFYEHCGYETFNSTGDIYCLFYERGNNLLRRGGTLCYITSNKWMRAAYGENLRRYLTEQTDPYQLIDFGETHVFESATVMTNILIFHHGENKHKLMATQIGYDFTDPATLSQYVVSHAIPCVYAGDETWIIMPQQQRAIKHKVEAQGTPLKDWDITINRGILTGYDTAFFVIAAQRQEILNNCQTDDERQRTEKIIRPMLRGKDIRAYGTQWRKTQLYLINMHNGVKPNIGRIHIEDYPAVKAHLDKFYDKLANRGDKGTTPYNLRNCAYLQEFDRPKIVYPETTRFMPFFLDMNEKYLLNKTCFFLRGKHLGYLIAFLNSSMFKYCFRECFPTLFGGARGIKKDTMIEIPVKDVDDATDKVFAALVSDIQEEYTGDKAKEIDRRIFDIYGLSQEEREAVGFIDFHNQTEEDEDDE